MRKKGVYILLLLFVLHNAAFNQLLKIPLLFSHFLYHQQLNRDISVTEFLCMHYWGEDMDDNDEEQDNKLPFKQVDAHTIHQTFIPLAKAVTIRLQECKNIVMDYPIQKDSYLPDPALSVLIQPPQA
ncbi:hypothetical protein [Chitinophaga nivalis]|uniref:Uncharacterized protein n=1 Tax=Chitinophaga nivalis TaxID=2991709 RepID=A0ABT3IGE8_9BACT|nr:hypothetical protein [Chitinophaga nivalis]MCW3467278.1 hypothetical protein [Chitinophaga nivalis]MCW3483030.1 hypothetical protein [Chitinophaga nivalis]